VPIITVPQASDTLDAKSPPGVNRRAFFLWLHGVVASTIAKGFDCDFFR
jgi:hypothetical protein